MTRSEPDQPSAEPDARASTADPDASQSRGLSQDDIGWILVGSGLFGAIAMLAAGRRRLAEWALPLSLVGFGMGMLGKRRQAHMDTAEEAIRAQLDALDPIARAQVLKVVTAEQLGRLGST